MLTAGYWRMYVCQDSYDLEYVAVNLYSNNCIYSTSQEKTWVGWCGLPGISVRSWSWIPFQGLSYIMCMHVKFSTEGDVFHLVTISSLQKFSTYGTHAHKKATYFMPMFPDLWLLTYSCAATDLLLCSYWLTIMHTHMCVSAAYTLHAVRVDGSNMQVSS